MYIKKIKIEKIKCFGKGENGVTLDLKRPNGDYAGWTVIAGRNGTGKSTFLQTLALTLAGPGAYRSLQDSFVRWINFDSRMAESTLELYINDMEKSDFPPNQNVDNISATFMFISEKGDGEPETYWGGTAGDLLKKNGSTEDSPESTSSSLKGPWNLNPKGWFVCGYGPFRRLPRHSYDLQRKKDTPRRVEQLISLFREDVPLLEPVPWLKDIYLRKLEKRKGMKELEQSIITLMNDGLLPEKETIERIDSDGLWIKDQNIGKTLPLNELSDGYRTVAALVLDLVRQLFNSYGEFKVEKRNGIRQALYPGIVLIDEMDTHMHVSWQQKIGFWLKNHFPRIQFIVSTHSPFICQAADPKGLIRLPVPGTEDVVEHVSEQLFRTVTKGTVDEAVLTDLFGLETPHSSQSEEIRDQLATLEVLMLRGKATEPQKKQYHELKKQLPDTQRSLVQQALRSLKKD